METHSRETLFEFESPDDSLGFLLLQVSNLRDFGPVGARPAEPAPGFSWTVTRFVVDCYHQM